MHFLLGQSEENEQGLIMKYGTNEKLDLLKKVDLLNGIYNGIERFLNCDAKRFILYARFMIEISMQHKVVF